MRCAVFTFIRLLWIASNSLHVFAFLLIFYFTAWKPIWFITRCLAECFSVSPESLFLYFIFLTHPNAKHQTVNVEEWIYIHLFLTITIYRFDRLLFIWVLKVIINCLCEQRNMLWIQTKCLGNVFIYDFRWSSISFFFFLFWEYNVSILVVFRSDEKWRNFFFLNETYP